MFDFDNWSHRWDDPPFTLEELTRAALLRQAVSPDWRGSRRDQCPHTPMCSSWDDCVRFIAWYLRWEPELRLEGAA